MQSIASLFAGAATTGGSFAALDVAGLPSVVSFALVALGGGFVWRAMDRKVDRRLKEADERLKKADARLKDAEAAGEFSDAAVELVAPLREVNKESQVTIREQRAEIRALLAEATAARASEAEARAEAARVVAQLAEREKVLGLERHEAVNRVTEQAGAMAREKDEEIGRLRAELAKAGGLERRGS